MRALTVGSQYRFRASISKDGAVWDLTGATVSIYFKRSDGTTFNSTASILDAINGKVYYDNVASDINMAGTWTRAWKITLGGVVDYTDPVQFTVVTSP